MLRIFGEVYNAGEKLRQMFVRENVLLDLEEGILLIGRGHHPAGLGVRGIIDVSGLLVGTWRKSRIDGFLRRGERCCVEAEAWRSVVEGDV